MVCTRAKYYLVFQNKGDEICRALGAFGGHKKYLRSFVRKPEKRDNLERKKVDVRAILKCILTKWKDVD
jgi:hypothetical protein